MEQTNPLPTVKEPCCVCAKKPYLMILCGILLVFLSSLATYLIVKSSSTNQSPIGSSTPVIQTSPTPSPTDETANWETYRNDKYGFELKYPSDFHYTEYYKEDDKPISTDIDLKYKFLLTDSKNEWFVQLSVPSEKQTPTELLNKFPREYYSTSSTFDLNNISGLKVKYGGPEEDVDNMVLFNSSDDDLFWFELHSVTDKQKLIEKVNLFNQILSTFNFLNKENQSSERDEIAKFVDDYMKAYISGDPNQIEKYISSGVMKEVNYDIIGSYGIKKYEVLSITGLNNLGQYFAKVRCYDSNNVAKKNSEGDPRLIIIKESNQWRTLSWYFFQ